MTIENQLIGWLVFGWIGLGVWYAAPSNGGEEAGFVAGIVKHLPNHKAGSGFAVGAGDADDAEILGGAAVAEGAENSLTEVPRQDGLIVKR